MVYIGIVLISISILIALVFYLKKKIDRLLLDRDLLKREIEIFTKNNEKDTSEIQEVNSKLKSKLELLSVNNKKIQRENTLLIEENKQARKLMIKEEDMVSILHEQSNALISVLLVQENLLTYAGDNPFYNTLTSLEKNNLIRNIYTNNFINSYKNIINYIANNKHIKDNIDNEEHTELVSIYKKLLRYKNTNTSSISIHFYRQYAYEAYIILNSLKTKKLKFKQELLREFNHCSKELQRIISIYDIITINESTKKINNKILNIIRKGDYGNDMNVDVVKLIHEQIKTHQIKADSKKIKITCKFKKDNLYINSNEVQLETAIGNLLDNAIKYTGKLSKNSTYTHPWIDIFLWEKDKKTIEISIASWGTPITKEEYNNLLIFSESYRGYFAKESHIQGSGIGLSDVHAFAKENNGKLLYETTPVDKPLNKKSKYIKNVNTKVTLELKI